MVHPQDASSAFTLALADLAFRVETPTRAWAQTLARLYRDFLHPGSADWRIHLHHRPHVPYADPPWARHTPTHTHFHIAFYQGAIHLPTHEAWITTPSLDLADSALARILITIATWTLPFHHSLLLHASGIDIHGQGLAFCGPSGAGKSTIARFAPPGSVILNDENLILRLTSATPYLQNTPFWGRNTPEFQIHRRRHQTPLTAIFLLHQSPTWSLERLSPAQAILALAQTEKVALERPQHAQAWMDTLSRLTVQTPIYRLGFRPTPHLWTFLQHQNILLS